MQRGFSGTFAGQFMERTNEAVQRASTAHNKPPLGNTTFEKARIPNLGTPMNRNPPFSSMGSSHTTGVGNSSNIVVDEMVYRDAINRLDIIDDQAGEEIYKMTCTIEEMCKNIYVVPATNPRVVAITEQLKGSLSQFRSLCGDITTRTRRYVDEVGNIDQAHGAVNLVASASGVQNAISNARTAADRQVKNMQSTATRYKQVSQTLKNRAASLKNQATNLSNQITSTELQIQTLEAQQAAQLAAAQLAATQ